MNIDDITDSCKGTLLGDVIEFCEKHCVVFHPEFALGLALFVVGAATQRAYKFPRGQTLGFHYIAGRPNCGKNDYIRIATILIRQIDSRLLADDPSSGKNMKKQISDFPSRAWVADEAGALLVDSVEGKDPHTRSQYTWKLKLWGGMDRLSASGAQSAEAQTSAVPLPKWSELGSMTNATVGKLYENKFYGNSGGLSRNCIWQSFKKKRPGYQFEDFDETDLQPIGIRLKRIFQTGMSKGGVVQKEGEAEAIADWLERPTKTIEWPADHPEVLEKFRDEWARIQSMHDADEMLDDDDSAESAAGRGSAKALSFVLIHCISSGREVISMSDVIWGCALATYLLKLDLERLTSASEEDKMRFQVLKYLERKPGGHSMSSVQAFCGAMREIKPDARKRFFEHMRDDGLIAMDPGLQKASIYIRGLTAEEVGEEGCREMNKISKGRHLRAV